MKSGSKSKKGNNVTLVVGGGLLGALLGTLFGLSIWQILQLYIEDLAVNLKINEIMIWVTIAFSTILIAVVFLIPNNNKNNRK